MALVEAIDAADDIVSTAATSSIRILQQRPLARLLPLAEIIMLCWRGC